MSWEEQALDHGAQQKSGELWEFRNYLLGRKVPPKKILEIGSLQGGMLWWFNRILEPTLLVSIDPVDQLRVDVREHTTVITGSSQDPEVFERASTLGPFDLIFIDGDHSYEGVRDDWNLYQKIVDPEGLIAFHDIMPHLPEYGHGVDRFWNELKESTTHQVTELVVPGGIGCGIGVINFDLT